MSLRPTAGVSIPEITAADEPADASSARPSGTDALPRAAQNLAGRNLLASVTTLHAPNQPATLSARLRSIRPNDQGAWPQALLTFLIQQTNLTEADIEVALNTIAHEDERTGLRRQASVESLPGGASNSGVGSQLDNNVESVRAVLNTDEGRRALTNNENQPAVDRSNAASVARSRQSDPLSFNAISLNIEAKANELARRKKAVWDNMTTAATKYRNADTVIKNLNASGVDLAAPSSLRRFRALLNAPLNIVLNCKRHLSDPILGDEDLDNQITTWETQISEEEQELDSRIKQANAKLNTNTTAPDSPDRQQLLDQLKNLETKQQNLRATKKHLVQVCDGLAFLRGVKKWAADPDSIRLPMTFKAMGARGQPPSGQSFVETLKGSGIGNGNHSIDRVIFIRNAVAGLMDQMSPGNYGRDDVKTSAALLKVGDSSTRDAFLEVVQSDEKDRSSASDNVNTLAAMNLVAAGYNPVTRERDAPSLGFKIEQDDFSSVKRSLWLGRAGQTVRTPAKHINPRLEALAGFQQIMEKEIYPSSGSLSVEHLLTSRAHLSEFGSLMIAALPQSFLITETQAVGEIDQLVARAGDKDSNFDTLKEEFIRLHERVRSSVTEHNDKQPEQVNRLIAKFDQAMIEVYRRGAIKRAVSAIAIGFMAEVGAPLKGLMRALREFRAVSSATVRFKNQMFRSQAKPTHVDLISKLDANYTAEATQDTKKLILDFLSGKSDRLDLENVTNADLPPGFGEQITNYAAEIWKNAVKGVPVPHNLVVLPKVSVDNGIVVARQPNQGGS